MRTVVLDPPTSGFEELIERRRRSGLDRLDEVWEGVLHMVPAPTGFYAAHDVDEVLIVDPRERRIHWLGLRDGDYAPIERSAVIDLGASELAEQIDWP